MRFCLADATNKSGGMTKWKRRREQLVAFDTIRQPPSLRNLGKDVNQSEQLPLVLVFSTPLSRNRVRCRLSGSVVTVEVSSVYLFQISSFCVS